jgi:O-antigen ligase
VKRLEQLKKLFNFQTFFTLFLFSAQYKNAAFLFKDPDITILLAVLLIPWAGIIYKKQEKRSFFSVPVSAFLIFAGWLFASVYWSPHTSYSYGKALAFGCFTLPAFLMAYFVIAAEEWRLKDFLFKVVIFSVLVTLACYDAYFLQSFTNSLSAVLGTNYLITGQTLGAGILILTVMMYEARHKPLMFSGLSLLCGVMFFAFLNLGARGPVVAVVITMVSMILTWFLAAQNKITVLKYLGWGGGIIATLFVVLKQLPTSITSTFGYRMQNIIHLETGAIADQSILERLDYYRSAWQGFIEHPFKGVGIGGWPTYHGLGDIHIHPHNIFLETMCELGVIGLSLLLVVLGSVAYALWNMRHKPFTRELIMVLSLLIFSGVNALKTGDYNDNILLFTCIGMLIPLTARKAV